MAKKSSYKFVVDAHVSLIFCMVCTLVFILDSFFLKGKMTESVFTCPGAKGAVPAFNFKAPLDYLRMFLFCLGNASWEEFFFFVAVILLLGPAMETRYGPQMFGLMAFISIFVSGVMTACISPYAVTGPASLVFTLVILSSLQEFNKRKIPASWAGLLVAAVCAELFFNSKNRNASGFVQVMTFGIPVFIQMIAGICGSIFGFLVLPKKRSTRSARDEEKEEAPVQDRGGYSSSDETVIGSISL